MSPFDFVESINSREKKDILLEEPEAEKKYSSFLTNKALSYFNDTLGHANRMNMLYHLDNKLQYHYYLNIIRPRIRRSKWYKKVDIPDLELIQNYYGYNAKQAQEALSILSPDQIRIIKNRVGGYT
jgi:hypothetical protein